MSQVKKQRWLITGVSSGLGKALAEAALARGDSVAGTVRNLEAGAAFAELAPGRAHPIQLEICEQGAIPSVIEKSIAKLGKIDVLVNNAGRGIVGACEELSEEEVENIFTINFFGALRMIRAILPHFREQGGHIVNISSAGGLMGFPGISVYCASKFAIEGLSEALVAELAPFGIGVTVVEPGAFRTNFSGSSIATPTNTIAVYDDTPAGLARDFPAQMTGSELGDPAKAATAILNALDAPIPPERLLLGSDAIATARGKVGRLTKQIDSWAELSASTDFDGAKSFNLNG